MNFNPIIIVWGEPNSIFTEIFLKSLKKYNSRKPLILIGSFKLFKDQIKKLKISFNLNLVNIIKNDLNNLSKKKLNFINVNYNYKKPFEKISLKSNNYLSNCFNLAFQISKNHNISGLINGPISKKYFLKKKFQGITEYLANSYKNKENFAMLIYNKSLSVLPITTHLPVDKISKKISKKTIILKSTLIDNFYKKFLSIKPKIAICGLNPHCENFFNKSEEMRIITPAINHLKKKKMIIDGPFPADTIFLEQNRKKFNVIIGMYHDQVLTPIKALHGFDAINITLGLPFIRISPDHGPNYNMIGKNKSNPQSLLNAIKFLNKKK
tara:strand:- start:353 stop:1324 length:972 start_codon:yes stop_codon:yes gene_type:complete